MNGSKYYRSYKKLQYESSYINKEDSPCHGIENISIFVQQNKTKLRKKYSNVVQNYSQPTVIFIKNLTDSPKSRRHITRHMSMPEINKSLFFKRAIRLRSKSSDTIAQSKYRPTNTKHIISKYSSKNTYNFLKYININQRNFKVYRCQVTGNNAENCNNCCCSCNSDTMFEVMKDLYDCYKKRNCDNCNCILCCNLPAGERVKGTSKSHPKLNLESALKEIAMKGFALPEGKTPSEKKLIDNIRNDLGLPPEPMSQDMREKYTNAANAGLMLPLEGKSPKQKEKILRDLHGLGILLPLGRTPSEKSLIAKILGKGSQRFGSLTENIQDAKRSGLLSVNYEGKSPEEIEKILKELAMRGIPLPEGEGPVLKKLAEKVRTDLGLPPEPKTPSMKEKHKKAAEAGLLYPLEGKSPEEKELILQGLANMQIPLPSGRTPSEKALIAKVQNRQKLEEKTASNLKEGKGPVDECICELLAPRHLAKLEKKRKAKVAGLLTPIKGKSKDQKEKILKGLAMEGFPLPKGDTSSDSKLIKKVRADLGLPPEPKNSAMRDKYAKAVEDGIMLPLEGKSPKEKEKILKDLQARGIPLPKGRTPSEKALILKISKEPQTPSSLALSAKKPKEKLSKPLDEEKIRDLAMRGLPLREGKTESDNKLLNKVRADLGLPPEPKTPNMRKKYEKAAEMGLMEPLEGKTLKEKEKILRGQANMGIPLPKGRTPSEKALTAKIKGEPRDLSMLLPSEEKMKLESEPSAKQTPSEKIRKAKDAGLLTPLDGKSPAQQEQILRGLGMMGMPLPKGNTASQNSLINKVRIDLGLPPEPKRSSMRNRYDKAADMGLLQPLEGKTPKEKEKILRNLARLNIPLPKGRTPSEQALIDKIQREKSTPSVTRTEKMRAAKAAGLLTPLKGKTPAQKEKILRGLAMNGLSLPEGKTQSEKDLINKVRLELGLPPEPKTSSIRDKYAKAADAGILMPLEGKTPKEKEKLLRQLADAGIPLPKARTPSEKALIDRIKGEPRALTKVSKTRSDKKDDKLGRESSAEKIRKAKAAGLLTPLDGKTPEQKEKILRGRAAAGLPLPKGKSRSEKDLINKIKASTGYVTPSPSETMQKAKAAGLLSPLDGKTPSEKEKHLRQMAAAGIPLPAGNTPSEQDMIKKLNAIQKSKSDKIKASKVSSRLISLKGKTPEQKEKILRGMVKDGIPLPEGKTPSEKQIIDKIRSEMGLPPEPKSPSMREKYKKAQAAGIITPLEGKTLPEKEKILRKLHKEGIPLPVGRTPSEKLLIKTVKAGLSEPSTPFEEMTPEKKEKLLRGLIKTGESLPDAKTPSGKELIKKVRKEMGLPPEAKTSSMKEKMRKAHSAGLITPLEGKTQAQKEKILRDLAEAGIPLPEGRTPSEKALIHKIEAEVKKKPDKVTTKEIKKHERPSEETDEVGAKKLSNKMKKAKELGLSTPLEGKSPEEKERILRELAKLGLPLPEGKTKSDKQLITNIRINLGLPPSPETTSMKNREEKAAAAGVLLPLEGLTPAEKEKLLRAQAKMGLPLPEGRTPSEKSLINKIKAEKSEKSIKKPRSSKLRKAKELVVLTPLQGKSPEEKEKILRELAKLSLPLPEGTTKSDKQLITNIRLELGLPPSPETSSMKNREVKAAEDGVLLPLEGLTPAEKEEMLRAQANIGLKLPEGRTQSEKSLINKIKEDVALSKVPPEKIRKAKDAGLLTPLKGKSPAEKERIIRGRAEAGLPLPEGRTSSEKSLIKRIGAEYRKPTSTIAPKGGKVGRKPKGSELLTSLTGKTAAEKEKILQGLAEAGLPLPEGKTSTEKALIRKVKEEHKAKKAESRVTCERACGCDKKKIKFKHSYVKIRVTSPDISSLCPCPDECIPGVKGGVFLDNDGINVIIERAADISQYKQFSNIKSKSLFHDNKRSVDKINYVTDPVPMYFGVKCKNCSKLLTSMYEDHNLKCSPNNNSQHSMKDIPLTYFSLSNERCHKTRQYTNKLRSYSNNKICAIEEDYLSPIPSHNSLGSSLTTFLTNPSTVTTNSSQESFNSIIIIKSETSLSFSTSYEEINSSSVIFSELSAITLKFNPYLTSLSNVVFKSSTVVDSESLTNGVKYCAADTNTSRENIIRTSLIAKTDKSILVNRNQMPDDVFQVFPMSSTKLNTVNQTKCNTKPKDDDKEPVIIITNLSSDLDLTSVVEDIISKKEFCEASSLFVVVPSDEENEVCCNGLNCNHCNNLPVNEEESCSLFDNTSSKIEDLQDLKQQKFFFEKVPTTIVSSINNKGNLYNYVNHNQKWLSGNRICQLTSPNPMFHRCHVVSTDTTQDRPCCCACGTIQSSACTTNVMSEVITPELITRGIRSNKSVPRKNNIQQASVISFVQSPTMSVGQISECCRYPSDESPEHILRYPLNSTEPGQLKNKFHSSRTRNRRSREMEQSDRRYYDSPTECSDEEDLLQTTSMTPASENYLICHEQKLKKNKLPKSVSGDKEVRIDAACDCKHKKPSFIKTEEESENKTRELTEQRCTSVPNRTKSFGQVISRLKRTTHPPNNRPGSLVSIGIQDSPGCILCLLGLPCTSEHNVSGRMTSLSNVVFQQTPVNIYGHPKGKSTLSPLRSYAAIGSGGIYTQGGSKSSPYGIDAGVGVDFRHASTEKYKSEYSNKRIQKNSNPFSQSALRTNPIPRYTQCENEVAQNKVTLMKPNITQTTSRMKFNNNLFLKQQVKPSWTIEDLIRYYAKFKPEVLQTLISLTSIKKPKDITYNEDRRYVYRHQPDETSEPPYSPESQAVLTKETHEVESRPFKGFKFEKPGASLDALTLLKKDIIQQASFPSSSTISQCEINPYQRRKACHSPEEALQFPFGTPLSEPLMKLKKLLEQNCTTEKVQYILHLIEAGNLKDIDWKDIMSISIKDPPSDLGISKVLECLYPPYHAPDEVLQYPFDTLLSPTQVKKLTDENYNVENIDYEMAVKTSVELQPNDGPVSVSNLTSISVDDPTSDLGNSQTLESRLPPCEGNSVCHAPNKVLYPFDTPLLPNIIEFKKLIQENDDTIKRLFGQIQARKNKTGETLLKQPNNNPFLYPTQIPYQLPPNQERSKYHPRDDFLNIPVRTPLSPYLVELQKLLEQRNNSKRVNSIMKRIENTNLINRDWERETVTARNSPDYYLPSNVVPKNSISVMSSCHSPEELLQYPYGYPLSPSLQILKNILEKYYNPYKVHRLFKQLEAGNYQNLDWMGALAKPPPNISPQNNVPATSQFCPPHLCGRPSQRSDFPYEYLPSQSAPAASNCKDTRCPVHFGYHGPYGSLPQNLTRLKPSIEQNGNPNMQYNNFETLERSTEFLPDNNPTSKLVPTISACRIPPCEGRSGCHLPDEVLRYPFGTPLPKNLEALKKLLEHDIDPKKIKHLFEDIEAGNLENLDWECALKILTDSQPDEDSSSCESSEDYVDDPPSIPKSSTGTCSMPRHERRSIASGGIHNQGCTKPTPHCIDVGVGVDFKDASTQIYKSDYSHKQIQKDSNPYPQSALRTKQIPIQSHRENVARQNKVTLMKPNTTQTTSRMNFDNNVFLKQQVKPSWTIEDLIRYYAKFKPEVLQTLVSLTSIKRPSVKDITYDEDGRYVYRHQPGGASKLPCLPQSQGVPTKETHEVESHPFVGFKIEKPGKISGASLYARTLLRKDITQQASFMSSSTVSRCEINPCHRRNACHSPEDVLQYPFGTPLSEPLIKLKKLLEQNCTPEKVQYIFQLIEAGNLKDIDWEEVMSTSIENQPSDLGISKALECQFPPCEGHPGCHAPDEILQYPFGTPLSPNLVELKKLVEENNNPDKIKQFFGDLETRKLKNIDGVMPVKSSIDLQHNGGPIPVSKLTSISIKDPPSDLRVSKALECQVAPCDGHPGCHAPDEVLQYPFGTPLSPNLVELKKLIEENNDPAKIKLFMKQLESQTVENVNCEVPMKRTIDLEPKGGPVLISKLTSMPNCNLPPCKGHPGCHLPDEVLQYPFGTRLPPDLLELKKLIERNESVEKVKKLYGQLQPGNIKTCETLLKQPNKHPFSKQTEMPLRLPANQESTDYQSEDDFLKNPLGTHLSPYLVELKKLLEQNNNSKKVNNIMKQIENANLNNRDWEEESEISPDDCKHSTVVPKNSTSIISSCHSPNQVPYGCPLSPSLQTLKHILERHYNPNKVQRLFRQIETGGYKNFDRIGTSARQPLNVPTQINAPATSHVRPPYSCGKRLEPSGGHLPHEVSQCPHDMDSPIQLETLKKILEYYKDPKVKRSFESMDSNEMENLYWMGSLAAATGCSPDQNPSSQSTANTSDFIDSRYPERLGCHEPKEVSQYPYDISLPQNVAQLKKLVEENSNQKYHCSNNFDWVETLKTCTDFLPDKYPTSELMPTISTCRIPPCHGRSGCHLPDDVLRYPFGTPLPQNLEEFKKLLDHDFDPKKIKRIFEEIEAGNLGNLDWECAMGILKELERHDADDVHPPSKPMPSVRKPTGATCRIPSCDGRSFCHSPDNLLQYPFGTPLPQHLEDLKKLLEDNCSPETVRHLFEQIEAGDLEDLKNIDCGSIPKIPVVIAPDVCEPSVCPPPVCPSPVCPPPGRRAPVRPAPKRQRPLHPAPVRAPCVSVGTDYSPPSNTPPTCAPKEPAVQPGSLPSTVIILPPEVYAPKPKDEDCGVCHKPKYRNGIKMKCACSGKKKTVKINPPCPCELHKVPISKEEPGLKINTRSIGDQCCICDEYSSKKKKAGQDVIFKLGQTAPSIIGVSDGPVSTGVQDGTGCIICPTGLPCSSEHTTCPKLTKTTIGPVPLGFFGQPDKKTEMGELEIIGPRGGYVIVGPEGMYTQAGVKEIRFSSAAATDPQFNNVGAESTSKVKKNCLCFGKRKKKRKIVCQCPSESDQEPLLLYTYADFEEARKQTKKYKSDLTQTTSGFKFNKKKKPETIPEAQYTMEDAIRDYAIIRPDFIRDLVPPGTVTRKGRKKDCACENDRGVDNYEILIPDGKGNFVYEKPPPEPTPVQEVQQRPVLKFSIGGKGSGSKGLSGICCFEMYQDP